MLNTGAALSPQASIANGACEPTSRSLPLAGRPWSPDWGWAPGLESGTGGGWRQMQPFPGGGRGGEGQLPPLGQWATSCVPAPIPPLTQQAPIDPRPTLCGGSWPFLLAHLLVPPPGWQAPITWSEPGLRLGWGTRDGWQWIGAVREERGGNQGRNLIDPDRWPGLGWILCTWPLVKIIKRIIFQMTMRSKDLNNAAQPQNLI